MSSTLPVGFQQFSRDRFLNLQLNRWYSEGYARLEDLRQAGAEIRTFADNKRVFLALAQKAEAEGRLANAAACCRAAEFLVSPSDPDKLPLYERYLALFYRAFAGDGIEQCRVPYAGAFLPVMRLASAGPSKGTVLIHGGFDSFIEEFYCFTRAFSEAGYDVVAFEGPGQGGALRLYGLPSEHEWEKPTKAVLDHFGLSDVTILGISMGGYWCLRAAAFEKRITRVIVFPPLLDWMESTDGRTRSMVTAMVKHERLMRALIRLKMKAPLMKHVVSNTLFITRTTDPMEVVRWELGMNRGFLHSELVDQDVLLLASEKDSLQPVDLYYKQREALTAARSVTGRVFTEADGCPHHVAIGNMGLAIDVMLEWLGGLGSRTGRSAGRAGA